MSPKPSTADLAPMFAIMGVDVTVGGVTVKGLIDEEGIEQLEGEGGGVENTLRTVIVGASAFPGLSIDDDIIVDGTNHRVTRVRPIEDGEYVRIYCGDPT